MVSRKEVFTDAPGELILERKGPPTDPVLALRQLPDGQVYQLDSYRYEDQPQQWISIGKGAHCDIRIDDESAESCHCILRSRKGRWLVKDDKVERRTLINGMPFAGEFGELFAGNLLTVGATTFLACGKDGIAQQIRIDTAEQKRRFVELRGAGEPPELSLPSGRKTRTRTRDMAVDSAFDPVRSLRQLPAGPTYQLYEYLSITTRAQEVSIGAGSQCAITIRDNTVSEHHCLLEHREGSWFVSDSASYNGSFLNGVPLTRGQAELVAGSLLTIGHTTLLACGRCGDEQTFNLVTADTARRGRWAVRISGAVNKAAKMLGVARSTLRGWLESKTR